MHKILLCDDDEHLMPMVSTYLQWYGFWVDGLRDSSQAVETLTQNRYDIFICSMQAQPVVGLDVCKNLRNSLNPEVWKTRILMVGLEDLDHSEYKQLARYDAYFMNKYRGAESWYEKITAIMDPAKTL